MEANQKSLLYLSYAVMHSDGVIQQAEDQILEHIIEFEKIPPDTLEEFKRDIAGKSLDELRKSGLDNLQYCSRQEQLRALGWIHKMIHADEDVDIKEAQFLMYAIKPTDIEFDELKEEAKLLPPFD